MPWRDWPTTKAFTTVVWVSPASDSREMPGGDRLVIASLCLLSPAQNNRYHADVGHVPHYILKLSESWYSDLLNAGAAII